jgi:molybdenum cofactor biosynthesis enzyme MoaA
MTKSDSLWANNRLRLIVAGDCNINCFYCHNEGQSKTFGRLSHELFMRVRELLACNQTKLDSVTFSGGEPLLHPGLDGFIEGVASFAARRTLVTNGLLLTPERLVALRNAGITKIRLGVDSLRHPRWRPSLGKFPRVSIQDIIRTLAEGRVNYELNVVLTTFNASEIPVLLQFCGENRISAKFFEHVKVHSFGTKSVKGLIEPQPLVPFEHFNSGMRSVFPSARSAISEDMGPANYIYDCGSFAIRYCRYLCPFGLCYKTGTRIDPFGFVYTCMAGDGRYKIDSSETLQRSAESVLASMREGCGLARRMSKAA